MASPSTQTGAAVSAKKDGAEVWLSDRSVETIINGISGMWESGLIWAERNPILFVIVVLALLVAFHLWMKQRTATRSMKIEYKATRKDAKVQMSLPFPTTSQPKRLERNEP